MRSAFDADQREAAGALRVLLERECSHEVAALPFDLGLWSRLAEMGVLGVRVEGDEVDLALLLEQCGRFLTPGPVLATAAVGIPALADAGEKERAQRAAEGKEVIALGFAGEAVAFADVADLLVLEAEGTLHAVPRDDVRLEPVAGFSSARPVFRVHWEPDVSTVIDASVELARERAAFAAAAEMIGGSARLIELAAGYAKERRQFGVPIGSFQAVKHLLATALVRLEFARPAVYRAAHALAHDEPGRGVAVSVAKSLASDAATLAARNALQVHGAIGYTEEHHLHLWLKAAWALSLAYGDATWHRERVAAHAL
jgi:Acyl-CoA dehydrogenase, C-terminal domain